MATETLAQATPARESAFVVDGCRGVTRHPLCCGVCASVVRVIRPAAWVLIAAAVVLWIGGQALGWAELTVAAVVLTVALALCTLFLIGRTAYDVSLDLTRTRVVVGERAVGALTLANSSGRAILPSRVVLPVGAGRGVFAVRPSRGGGVGRGALRDPDAASAACSRSAR